MEPASHGHAGQSSRPTAKLAVKEPLQIRIPVAVKRRFKAHAAMLGLEPNALFIKVWDHYEAASRSGGTIGKGEGRS